MVLVGNTYEIYEIKWLFYEIVFMLCKELHCTPRLYCPPRIVWFPLQHITSDTSLDDVINCRNQGNKVTEPSRTSSCCKALRPPAIFEVQTSRQKRLLLRQRLYHMQATGWGLSCLVVSLRHVDPCVFVFYNE
jgi:hypothetical protein